MKNILKYLLLCCSALSLFGCEDYLDKTPQGDLTEADVFTRFNETEQLINRLYFYVRAADQPLVHIRFFSDSTLADECEGSSAENGWSNKFNEGDWEPGSADLHFLQRHDQRWRLPHLLACALSGHPLRKCHSRRHREIQHARFAGTPRNNRTTCR